MAAVKRRKRVRPIPVLRALIEEKWPKMLRDAGGQEDVAIEALADELGNAFSTIRNHLRRMKVIEYKRRPTGPEGRRHISEALRRRHAAAKNSPSAKMQIFAEEFALMQKACDTIGQLSTSAREYFITKLVDQVV